MEQMRPDGIHVALVVAHPDDETLCCAGVIQRVRAAGGHVSVVWITSGDGTLLSMLLIEKSLLAPAAQDLATRRMREARRSALTLTLAHPLACAGRTPPSFSWGD